MSWVSGKLRASTSHFRYDQYIFLIRKNEADITLSVGKREREGGEREGEREGGER